MATRITVVSFTLLLIGCADVSPLGSATLELAWRVSPSGCDSASVEAVEVRATGPQTVIERFACSTERAELVDLQPGEYHVTLVGFDANGSATFESQPANVELVADEVATPPTIRLLAAPAQVDVRWSFSNGRVCGANDVRWITIGAFDEFDYEVATAEFSCDAGEGQLPALRAGSYLLEVNGLDASASLGWTGTSPVKVTRGDEVVVDVQLSPRD